MNTNNTPGATFHFNAPVYNYGTLNGDVVNPQYPAQSAESPHPDSSTTTEGIASSITEAVTTAVPDVFTTAASMALLQKLIDHHFIDATFQPIGLSWAERSILVDELAARLNIIDKWQTFGTLWHVKPQVLRSAYNRAMDQKKTSLFFDRIRDAMEG